VFELFLAWPIDSTPNIPRISDDLVEGGSVRDYKISPTGGFIVYRADQEVDEKDELFVVYSEVGPFYLPLVFR
jgi:hypothetical protein